MDKAAEVVAGLTEQLGVAASDVWPALVWREQVRGGIEVGFSLMFFLVYVVAGCVTWRRWADLVAVSADEAVILAMIVFGVVVAVACPLTMGSGLLALLAPEAAAVETLMKAMAR